MWLVVAAGQLTAQVYFVFSGFLPVLQICFDFFTLYVMHSLSSKPVKRSMHTLSLLKAWRCRNETWQCTSKRSWGNRIWRQSICMQDFITANTFSQGNVGNSIMVCVWLNWKSVLHLYPSFLTLSD